MLLGVLIALAISTFDEIYILEKGSLNKAIINKKDVQYEGIDIWFRFNDKESHIRTKKDYIFGVGDTISFFYLNKTPNTFVLADKRIKDFYFQIALGLVLFVCIICVLYYTLRNWNNANLWMESR